MRPIWFLVLGAAALSVPAVVLSASWARHAVESLVDAAACLDRVKRRAAWLSDAAADLRDSAFELAHR